jgi:hypothetical protein
MYALVVSLFCCVFDLLFPQARRSLSFQRADGDAHGIKPVVVWSVVFLQARRSLDIQRSFEEKRRAEAFAAELAEARKAGEGDSDEDDSEEEAV